MLSRVGQAARRSMPGCAAADHAARPPGSLTAESGEGVDMGRMLVRRWARAATLLTVVSLAVMGPAVSAAAPSGPPTSVGRGGAATTVERLATDAAIDAMRQGGNAVDAAVTAAAVLGLTEPFSAGIGGGGFMVILRAGDGLVTTIDHRETAPAAMHPASFMENGRPLAFNDARYSGLSAGVPGTVAGWATALERYGTFSLREALRPATHLAARGFVVDQTFADQVQQNADYFDDIPATARLFLDRDGTPPDVGTVFRNPDLARTYARIAALGPAGFYRGPVADAIVATVNRPPVSRGANHVWRPGVMTTADLAAYTALEREPTHVDYRGLDVYGMGPPSSGGSTVGEALNILEGFDLGSMSREAALHLLLEASRFAFADRNAYVADPAFFDVPLQGLLSDGFAAQRRSLITDRAAASPVAPGDPYPFDAGPAADVQPSATVTRSGSTTHLNVSDRQRNVVSYTFTIESTGGNGMVVPGWGFLLNNELTDFNFDSTTHPNRVEGGKRPRSSMAPTIVLRDGAPFLSVGTPGGSMIITTVLQILVERIDLGRSLPEAIAAPRASQRNTAATSAEPAFIASPEARALEARGHRFTPTAEIGAASGIEFLDDGRVLAAAEPVRRGGGSAAVERP
jgi:gamma-glutamyltranspeptidase / glutathione hydrolase